MYSIIHSDFDEFVSYEKIEKYYVYKSVFKIGFQERNYCI